ncbi:Holliday junction branch migration protein RuvA [Rothia sp. AR01]|uniref:Holliday junction branch migration complex subunit RuvA n=1 Tax=Rothia santali TaxID=2949643 RepID=A0A9X2HGF5_9MICC|nr:Holliday junction branch migration protein RuvA [Rothia santali]MCP3427242.1 Holliday junction branch migration protein RuvA [Rothia santali]
MISSLHGTVGHVGLHDAVIEVGGVGMLVHATPDTLAGLRLGEQARVQTSLIVREDSLTLFGFRDAAEREVFETMLSVSGIGPRIALAVLSVYTPRDVAAAVASGDDKAFSKVPGIGPKGARRIVLELAGKLVLPEGDEGTLDIPGPGAAAEEGPAWRSQVEQALYGLGWNEKDAAAAVAAFIHVEPEADSLTVPAALKAVLASLGKTSGIGHRS